MVKIVHSISGENAEKEVREASFILTNNRGGYAFISSGGNASRYNGVHFLSEQSDAGKGQEPWKIFKAIDSISLEKNATSIRNEHGAFQRVSGESIENFSMHGSGGFNYAVSNYDGSILVDLDCREMHDYDDAGRAYSVKVPGNSTSPSGNGLVMVEYRKFSWHDMKDLLYSVFIAISGEDEDGKALSNENCSLLGEWQERNYAFDCERNSMPWHLYTYRALSIRCKSSFRLSVGFGKSESEAIENCRLASEAASGMQKKEKAIKPHFLPIAKLPLAKKEARIAYRCAINSLDMLRQGIIGTNGIFAGLPWYTQFWTRDEGVVLGALIAEGNYSFAKEILLRHISMLRASGRIDARFPRTDLGGADAAGWAFFRLGQLIKALQRRGQLPKYFHNGELKHIFERIHFSIDKTLENYVEKGLIKNGPLETWMDTAWENDTRQGKRIEIQCLFLATLSTAAHLAELLEETGKKEYYREVQHDFEKRVKESFFREGMLYDGEGDSTQRPNVFLSYYIYPRLLSKAEWESAFKIALDHLWLDWEGIGGGLASIDKSHPLFSENYTGQDNRSYHRGDSWFYINNIAGIAMMRLGRMKYFSRVNKIVSSSSHEILFSGAVGHAAELSSASALKSQGCQAQAWSASSFIELMNEFRLSL